MTTPIAQLIAELRMLGTTSAHHCEVFRRAAEALADYQAVRDERDTLASNYANLLADTSGEIAGLRSDKLNGE